MFRSNCVVAKKVEIRPPLTPKKNAANNRIIEIPKIWVWRNFSFFENFDWDFIISWPEATPVFPSNVPAYFSITWAIDEEAAVLSLLYLISLWASYLDLKYLQWHVISALSNWRHLFVFDIVITSMNLAFLSLNYLVRLSTAKNINV